MATEEAVVIHGVTLVTSPSLPWERPAAGGCSDPSCITEEFTLPDVGEKEVLGEILDIGYRPPGSSIQAFM
jgi:hypothetical protein